MIKVFCGIKLKTMSALGNWRQAQNESLAISLWAKTVQLISWPPAQQWNTGGGKENTKNRKTLEKSWTLSSGQYPPTSLITKKSKLCVDHQKEMSTEIKTNCDKHRLWHHCLGGKNSWKGVLVLLSISESLIIFSCPYVPATVPPAVICCPLCCTFWMEKIYFRNDTTTKKKF